MCALINTKGGKEHHNASSILPEHLDQSRDASRLEDCKEALAVVGKIVQGASGAAGSLQTTSVLHGANNGRNHLWGAHQGVARRLFLRQLMHHYSCFVHNNLRKRQCLLDTHGLGRGENCIANNIHDTVSVSTVALFEC